MGKPVRKGERLGRTIPGTKRSYLSTRGYALLGSCRRCPARSRPLPPPPSSRAQAPGEGHESLNGKDEGASPVYAILPRLGSAYPIFIFDRILFEVPRDETS